MGDVTNRVLLIFAHPKHTKEKPNLVAVRLLNFLEYGPPETKKRKPYTLFETHLIQ